MTSELCTYDLTSGAITVVLRTPDLIEAPNWEPSGHSLIVNGGGRLYRVALATGGMTHIEVTGLTDLNNDHGLSPDGRTLAVSDSRGGGTSTIHTLPATGGTPTPLVETPGSYWHGWSPDGATVAYCGLRDGSFDIYTCPAAGGPEARLTGPDDGHNDGPDYSPDGRWIWFNSDRSGHAQIWRVPAGGGTAERMTRSKTVDWFPHPSPDGRHVLYLAYPPGTQGHPRDRDVALRLMRPDGRGSRDIARFHGGQGSINVPCWRADGGAFAFVRYPPD